MMGSLVKTFVSSHFELLLYLILATLSCRMPERQKLEELIDWSYVMFLVHRFVYV